MYVDYILNGQAHGDVAGAMLETRFEPNLLRPFIDSDGKKKVLVNTGRTRVQNGKPKTIFDKVLVSDLRANGMDLPVFNSTSLRKEEWIMLDQQILRAARPRLRAWADLASQSSFGGFNGMSKMILEHETMSDNGEALVDMDAVASGRTDAPRFQLEGLPLPITHANFFFTQRRLAVSRNSQTPLDSTMAEMASRRVAEAVEKTLIGVQTGLTYGGQSTHYGGYGRASTVYGYTNFPARTTKTNMTVPTGSNPEATVYDVLTARDTLFSKKFYGPFMLYHSTDWDRFMDNDYQRLVSSGNSVGGTMTLRNRLRMIDDIQDVRRLDYLDSSTNPYTMILVQMTSDVARAVEGLQISTVQWETQGGMMLNFKVMCILVPQLRADFYGNCGILHMTTS